MESFKKAIQAYLDSRAQQDELFAATYAKKNKSIDGCCNYIMSEARKLGNAVCMRDEDVFGLAVHYYDEDSIKDVKPVKPSTVVTSNVATSPVPMPMQQPAPVMHVSRSKKAVDSRQMSLF
nr:Cas9 inhibitor AcrIIA9 family protein [uncultured Macellibacteroides sp.]